MVCMKCGEVYVDRPFLSRLLCLRAADSVGRVPLPGRKLPVLEILVKRNILKKKTSGVVAKIVGF